MRKLFVAIILTTVFAVGYLDSNSVILVGTTTTTSTTTTSSSSSSSSSTSTSSTTSTLIQAVDWRADSRWRVGLDFNNVSCAAGQIFLDSTPRGNPMTSAGGCDMASTPTPQEGAFTLHQTSDTTAHTCDAGNSCTDGDFDYTTGDFTAFCQLWRDAAIGGQLDCLMCTDSNPLFNSGDGWCSCIDAVDSPVERYRFSIDNGSTQVVLRSAVASTTSAWHHVAVRYTDATNLMEHVIDGITDANTATSNSPGVGSLGFSLGFASNAVMLGNWDVCYTIASKLSNEDLCRIAVCNVSGDQCFCGVGGDPTQYAIAARHSSQGGDFACTLPACNKAGPD